LKDDARLKIVYPEDGVVTQFNTMGVPKKKGSLEDTLKVAEWFFTEDGQNAMIKSYMHSPVKGFKAPEGAPTLSELKSKSFPWTDDLIKELTEKRFDIKEKYVEIVFK
jgi:ABC-type Fe3+ transport system substrate-binding protein